MYGVFINTLFNALYYIYPLSCWVALLLDYLQTAAQSLAQSNFRPTIVYLSRHTGTRPGPVNLLCSDTRAMIDPRSGRKLMQIATTKER